MKLAIMQPYFFPYIGYFQLIAAADLFVVYDDVNFIKNGWINRNRILVNGEPRYINVAIRGASSFRKIKGTDIDPSEMWRERLLKSVEYSYKRAPFFNMVFPVIVEIVRFPSSELSEYLLNSLKGIMRYLEIGTALVESSATYGNDNLRAQERIIDICMREGATEYINAIGGKTMNLYSGEAFRQRGIDQKFIRSRPIEYPQFGGPFVPWLSIVDVMMFNPLAAIQEWIESSRDLI